MLQALQWESVIGQFLLADRRSGMTSVRLNACMLPEVEVVANLERCVVEAAAGKKVVVYI